MEKRALWVAVGIAVVAGLAGCARFSGARAEPELLLFVTAHVIVLEDDPPEKPGPSEVKPPSVGAATQVAILVRMISADTEFIDGLGVKWQPLAAPKTKDPGADSGAVASGGKVPTRKEPPMGWGGSGTAGWGERVKRTSSPVQWSSLDREQVQAAIRVIRSSPGRAATLYAPRATLFVDHMGNVEVSTRRGFVRSYDNSEPEPKVPNFVCRAIAHVKSEHEIRLYLDMAIGLRPVVYLDVIEADLNAQTPPDASALHTNTPSGWRLDANRVCIVTDMPDGGTIAIRCPGFAHDLIAVR